MTLQKNKTIRNFLLIFIGIAIVGVIFGLSDSSCGIQHMKIIYDLRLYQESLDPEFCEEIVEKIDLFNDRCEPVVEILDCG